MSNEENSLVNVPKKRGRPKKTVISQQLQNNDSNDSTTPTNNVDINNIALQTPQIDSSSFLKNIDLNISNHYEPTKESVIQENVFDKKTNLSKSDNLPNISSSIALNSNNQMFNFDLSFINNISSFFQKNAKILSIVSLLMGLALISVFYFFSLDNKQSKQSLELSQGQSFKIIEQPVLSENFSSVKIASSVEVIDNKVSLKSSRSLEDSIVFANGSERLGPIARSKAKEIVNSLQSDEQLFLYGYAGKMKNKQEQKNLAQKRAISTKVYMVNNLNADPKDITVVNPNFYLFKNDLPVPDKQVKTVIRKK